jgi:hypothetical protein
MSDDPRVDPFEWRPGGDAGRGAPLRSSRTLAAILPNGRVLWLDVGPAPATAASLARLADLARGTLRRRRAALQRQRIAIALVARLSAGAARRVARAKVARSRALRRQLTARTHAIDRRLAKARETLRKQRHRHIHVQRESVRRIHRRDLWDKLVLGTSLPLFAAYGEAGRPFAAGNLALMLNTLLWLVGDDVVDAVFGPEEPSPYAANELDVWSYIAPFGNFFSGHWLLRDFQHERFVSGFAQVPGDAFAVTRSGADLLFEHAIAVRMDRVVGSARFPDFQSLRDVPAVASIRSLRFSSDPRMGPPRALGTSAQVIDGILVIFFRAAAQDLGVPPAGPVPPVLESLEIAWMVDTAPRAAARN